MVTRRKVPERWTRHDDKDDPAFTKFVDGLTAMFAAQVKTVFLVRVDNWFGPKWLGFQARVSGAFGVRAQNAATQSGPAVIPPFKPSRIVSERRFIRGQEQWGSDPSRSNQLLEPQT